MANIEILFNDYCEIETRQVSVKFDGDCIGIYFQDVDENDYKQINLDKSTAILFMKILRSEIKKMK